MAENYRSLIGGFFWDGTYTVKGNKKVPPVSIRANNPGAVNGAAWEKEMPGYVKEIKYDGKNNTTIFQTPEDGIAVYWELLRRYRDIYGRKTVWEILLRYIGKEGVQGYYDSVKSLTGYAKDHVVNIDDDKDLLPFAKAQFRHEAGVPIPWSDEQILYGFNLGRAYAKKLPPLRPPPLAPQPPPKKSWWVALLEFFFKSPKPEPPPSSRPILRIGDKSNMVRDAQQALAQAGFMLPANVDGDFGPVTLRAVKAFQVAHNLDPDGEIGDMTSRELYGDHADQVLPPEPPPKPSQVGGAPLHYQMAQVDIGFRETGNNQGIEQFIKDGKTGQLGDPYCAIWVNAKLENVGVGGSRSAMARSFERHPNFIKLAGPALGAIVTMWRNSPSSGSGHVFFYDGESNKGVRGIGANENDGIRRSFHDRSRITGYYWPKKLPPPKVGKILVNDAGEVVTKET